jgi:hypothetical protein
MRRKTSSLIVTIALYEPAPVPPAPMETNLPHTASSSPRLALMGPALVAGGLLLGRKTR